MTTNTQHTPYDAAYQANQNEESGWSRETDQRLRGARIGYLRAKAEDADLLAAAEALEALAKKMWYVLREYDLASEIIGHGEEAAGHEDGLVSLFEDAQAAIAKYKGDSMSTTPECRKHPGFYDLGGYFHAKRLKNGAFSLYQGSWVDKGCCVGYLESVRDSNGKSMRFDTLTAARTWIHRGEA